jgi:hypothetical protein
MFDKVHIFLYNGSKGSKSKNKMPYRLGGLRMIAEKKDKVVSLRMSKDDYKLFQIAAYTIGLTPSKLVRMLADSSINAVRVQIQKGQVNIEDFKTLLDD